MSAVRVLLVSNEPGILGGGEVSLLLLLEGLRGLEGIAPVLAVPRAGEMMREAESLCIDVMELPLPSIRRRPWGWPAMVRGAGRTIAAVEPDLVHLNGSRAMAIAGVAAKRLEVPTVWHVRVEGGDRLDRWLERKASAVVVPSRTVAGRFRGEKVRVLPNPVRIPDSDPLQEEAGRLRRRFAAGGEMLFLAAGRISPHKGQDRIIRALAGHRLEAPWKLLVAGREDPLHTGFTDRLVAEAERLGVHDRVELLGFREDLPQLMAASDLLIHAPDHEGFGRVFVEAMAVGLPLVALPVGGLVELHRETGYGWLASGTDSDALAEAVSRAVEDAPARARFRSLGPTLARERFSVEAHAHRVADLYRELMERGP